MRRTGLKGRVGLVVLALVVALVAAPRSASAHPLGNFTINHYSRLDVGAAGVGLTYVVDMAEIPTTQEKPHIDTNGDGQISDAEKQAYLNQDVVTLASNVRLAVNGVALPLRVMSATMEFLPGQGGLQTTRITAQYETAALSTTATSLDYIDTNFVDRVGWKEVVVRNATGVSLTSANVPSASQSDELRAYPQDMLASPLAVTSASAQFRLDPTVVVNRTDSAPTTQAVTTQAPDRTADPFADLLKSGTDITLGFILFAFGAAFVLGMLHAMSPGHGKSVVGAYLVGTRGTAKHAVFLGAVVTITHTLGVFALGLLTLFASQYIVPDKLYPYLNLLSGVLVLVLGVNLFYSRIRTALFGVKEGAHNHSHAPVEASAHSFDFASALPSDGDDGNHDHPGGELVHSHGGLSHSHLPPGADGTPLTWRKLLVFGISAGLIPCPSALVVMLSAIALDRVAFGLILIVFFSMGLAATLTGLGLLFVYARPLMSRVKAGGVSSLVRFAPAVGALVVTIVGLVLSYQGFIQTGLVGS